MESIASTSWHSDSVTSHPHVSKATESKALGDEEMVAMLGVRFERSSNSGNIEVGGVRLR